MKLLLTVLIGILLATTVVWADDEKLTAEKKAEVKAEAVPAVEAKQVLDVLQAFGAVAEVFAGAVGAEVVGGDPLEQQFLQQFRQLSKAELNFVRAVCQPNAEQSKKIKAAGDVGGRGTDAPREGGAYRRRQRGGLHLSRIGAMARLPRAA